MNEAIRALEPAEVWNRFADLNAVPRPSKKEERVIDFMVQFGKQLGLSTEVDKSGNVLIRKPATVGMQDRKTVVMQAHLDMVHQKNADTDFDFDTQGIAMYVDGDWVRAKGTTLGADNGLGVACIMAVLASKNLSHPAIEALFTIDEETGMTGALGLEGGWLTGDILLNLDTEEDDEIGVGCAGGIDVSAHAKYNEEPLPAGFVRACLTIKGLQGGHSGMDIHKGLGNANKLMNRCLIALGDKIRIARIDGGGLRNAIPRESRAWVAFDPSSTAEITQVIDEISQALIDEYHLIEPDLQLLFEEDTTEADQLMPFENQQTLLSVIEALHNGVYRMSPAIADLVETSNNLARVQVGNGEIRMDCLTRSSVETSKQDLVNSLKAVFDLAGYQVEFSGEYPGWAPNMDSAILKVLDDLYKEINGKPAHVAACHAGLECGILGRNYPGMDMISIGPTIRGAHSPDERASISSLQKFWVFLKRALEETPKQ